MTVVLCEAVRMTGEFDTARGPVRVAIERRPGMFYVEATHKGTTLAWDVKHPRRRRGQPRARFTSGLMRQAVTWFFEDYAAAGSNQARAAEEVSHD